MIDATRLDNLSYFQLKALAAIPKTYSCVDLPCEHCIFEVEPFKSPRGKTCKCLLVLAKEKLHPETML